MERKILDQVEIETMSNENVERAQYFYKCTGIAFEIEDGKPSHVAYDY